MSRKIKRLLIMAIFIITMFALQLYAASIKPCNTSVLVNNKLTQFYTYTIGGKTYYSIRDIAIKINKTTGNFDVVTDKKTGVTNIITNKAYTVIGGEMQKPDLKKPLEVNSFALQKDGVALNLNSYKIKDTIYLEINDICKLLNLKLSFNKNKKTVVLDSINKPDVLPPTFEVGMKYGRMEYDTKLNNYIGIDNYGNIVNGWLQTGEGEIRFFYIVPNISNEVPVIFCKKDILIDGRYYFLDSQLLYSKTINGINIPLDADGGIAARDLQRVLGAQAYKEYIENNIPVHLYKVGYPAPRKLPADKTKYSLNLGGASINISNYQTYQLNPKIIPVPLMSKKYIYSSSNKSVAFVDEDGIIYGISNGSCTVNVSLKDRPDVTAKINVTVTGCTDIKNKLKTGFELFDYLDDDVGKRYLASTVDAAKMDGASWVTFMDSTSYYQIEPTIIGPGRPMAESSTFHSINDQEFKTLVDQAHKQNIKFAAQTQIMYDQLSEVKNLNADNIINFYDSMLEIYSKDSNFIFGKAFDYRNNPQGKEINEFWDNWFAQYKGIMLPYAAKCQKYGADMLILGEFKGNAWYQAGEDRWHKLLADIRKVYSGPIAVDCNVSENSNEIDWIKFIDDVDYIQVVLPEPLSSYPNPTVSQFKEEMDKKLKAVDDIYKKTGKKIFLTVNIRSAQNGGNMAWFDAGSPMPLLKRDFAVQVRMFEGLFEALQGREWLEAVWANGYHYMDQFEAADGSLNSFDLIPSVRNKPASQIFKVWSK